MRRAAIAVILLALTGCGEKQAAVPPPVPMPADAVGRYCGMSLNDHPGPKGQVQMKGGKEVYWFSSARDTVAFTLLPEEPKDIAAIYVTAMDKAASWDKPGDESWIDAHKATYVVDSNATGGMGQREIVPFSTAQAAEAFRIEHGGAVQPFDRIPREQVLGEDTPAVQHKDHPHGGAHQ